MKGLCFANISHIIFVKLYANCKFLSTPWQRSGHNYGLCALRAQNAGHAKGMMQAQCQKQSFDLVPVSLGVTKGYDLQKAIAKNRCWMHLLCFYFEDSTYNFSV